MKKFLKVLILTITIFVVFTGCASNNSSYDPQYENSDGINKVESSKTETSPYSQYSIPNSVESIGSYVFYDCNNLTDIHLSNNIIEIGGSTFGLCDKLEAIHYSGTSDE